MSMLSAQCDKMRAMAESVGMAMPQAATLMMDAADTILELRCKCADLMGEREEYVWTREFMDRMAKHCGTKDCPSLVAYVEGLESENASLRGAVEGFCDQNAKLRELVRHLYECMCNVDADGNHECDSCEYNDAESECDFERLMREMGIEVEP